MAAIDFPDSPVVGDTLTVDGKTWTWDGSFWNAEGTQIAGVTVVSDTAPSDPIEGNAWFNSLTGRLYTYYDGYWIEVGASVTGDGTLPSIAVSSNTTLESNNKYFVDTTAARTITLPSTPLLGDEVYVIDASGQSATNNITVDRNGNLINGQTENALIDVDQSISVFMYTGSTVGWRFE